MRWEKITTTLFLGLLCAAFLNGQSLYELAQKEKQRRAKLQGKTSRVVTNADLRSSNEAASVRTTAQPAAKRQPQSPTSSSNSSNPRVVPNLADQQRVRRETTESNPKQDRGLTRSSRLQYATEVLSSNQMVQNPDLALRQPDSQYAEIEIFGVLDLLLTAHNGSGADIAIFSRLSGAEAVKKGGSEEGGVPSAAFSYDYVGGFWYGVLAMNDNGEWIDIGKGSSSNGPDEFDLGGLASTTKIRIMFQPHNNARLPVKSLSNTSKEMKFGIDAIAALH